MERHGRDLDAVRAVWGLDSVSLKPAIDRFALRVSVLLAALLIIAVCLLTGCASTPPLDHDIFPAGYESAFQQGRDLAVQDYKRDYHGESPVIPFIRGYISDTPYNGGAWYTNGRITLWKGQPNPVQALRHEWGHALDANNGKAMRWK